MNDNMAIFLTSFVEKDENNNRNNVVMADKLLAHYSSF